MSASYEASPWPGIVFRRYSTSNNYYQVCGYDDSWHTVNNLPYSIQKVDILRINKKIYYSYDLILLFIKLIFY